MMMVGEKVLTFAYLNFESGGIYTCVLHVVLFAKGVLYFILLNQVIALTFFFITLIFFTTPIT